MTTHTWLPLTDYSLKYKVSISTLRRRIKCEKIQFRLDDGKYFLLDTPPTRQFDEPEDIQLALPNVVPSRASGYSNQGYSSAVRHAVEAPMASMDATNRVIDELKKAYALILQEKEQQILQLRGEIADLRTLVKVLEQENHRLTGEQNNEGKSMEDLPSAFY